MNTNDYIIRRENENDHFEVENLIREAFWNQYKPGCNEHYFAHILRAHPDFVPELDYVAELDGKLVASIMYEKARLTDENGNVKEIVTPGPISVLPEFQRRGLSRLLLEKTFAIAAEIGYEAVVNFGDPCNYIKRGYKSCRKYNVCLEGGVFPSALLVKELKEGALDGRRYIYSVGDAETFSQEAAEEFDRRFPPKEKGWSPHQEEFYIYSHSSIN